MERKMQKLMVGRKRGKLGIMDYFGDKGKLRFLYGSEK